MVKLPLKPALAIHGGTPTRSEYLPFHRPLLGLDEEESVVDTLRSGWITRGPKTKRFEREFAEFVGANHALALNSCTAAMHLSLLAAGVGPGDEVITSPFTFPSTVNVILHAGARPVFVDIEPDTLNIDASRIAEAISPRTKAIVPVHFAGHPCDMDSILALASESGIVVVEDAAHAAGAEYQGRKIGSIADATCFSFYATKNITTGEGGMLTASNKELSSKAAMLSLHGITSDALTRYAAGGYEHFEIESPGFKYNMSDIQASIGLCQLKKAELFWNIRSEQVAFYNQSFAGLEGIVPPTVRKNVKPSYHLYVIQIKEEILGIDRDTFMRAMQAENIGISVHFRAVHLHPYYRESFGFERGMFPQAEYASDRVLSLPLYPGLSREDMELVSQAVHKVARTYLNSGRNVNG